MLFCELQVRIKRVEGGMVVLGEGGGGGGGVEEALCLAYDPKASQVSFPSETHTKTWCSGSQVHVCFN